MTFIRCLNLSFIKFFISNTTSRIDTGRIKLIFISPKEFVIFYKFSNKTKCIDQKKINHLLAQLN